MRCAGGPDSFAIGVPEAQEDRVLITIPLAAEPPRLTSNRGHPRRIRRGMVFDNSVNRGLAGLSLPPSPRHHGPYRTQAGPEDKGGGFGDGP
jgi:hypothetical protein